MKKDLSVHEELLITCSLVWHKAIVLEHLYESLYDSGAERLSM